MDVSYENWPFINQTSTGPVSYIAYTNPHEQTMSYGLEDETTPGYLQRGREQFIGKEGYGQTGRAV